MSRPQRLSRRQFLGTAGAAGALVVLGGPATLARSSGRSRNTSVVVRWNEALVQAIRQSRMGPPMVARALAMAHTCMYAAWAAYDARAVGTRLGGDLRRHHREQRRAHKETAISVAAYRAAVDLFPAAASGVFDPPISPLPPASATSPPRRSWTSVTATERTSSATSPVVVWESHTRTTPATPRSTLRSISDRRSTQRPSTTPTGGSRCGSATRPVLW